VSHLDEDALVLYALLPDGSPEDPETAAHLGECEECTVRLNGTRTFLDALVSLVSWDIAGVLEESQGNEEQLLAFAARVQQEYEEAQAALAPVLTHAVAFVRERVDRRDQYRTLGAVRVLAEAANAACEREPIHARNLADAAVCIADALPVEEYPLDAIRALRGLAWKERANALRYLAEYDAALAALDHAGKEFEHFGTRSFEFASLAYIRAVILTYTDRLDEATQQAALSAEIYAEYAELERAMRARSVQAGVLYYRREYGAAVAIFEELLAYAESNKDSVETARQAYNVAACLIELGDGPQAERFLMRARDLYAVLGLHTEVARTDWKLGVVPRLVGNFGESVSRLRIAKASCEQLGLADAAASAALDLMESLLLQGITREIAALCSDVMRHYRRAGKVRQALTAIAFLKEATMGGTIRVETVRHVRKFVEALDRQPELLFVPLVFLPPAN
jgi:tetratricopeptide (TPR) repeat protein